MGKNGDGVYLGDAPVRLAMLIGLDNEAMVEIFQYKGGAVFQHLHNLTKSAGMPHAQTDHVTKLFGADLHNAYRSVFRLVPLSQYSANGRRAAKDFTLAAVAVITNNLRVCARGSLW